MLAWLVSEPIPSSVEQMIVRNAAEIAPRDFDIAFSAVEADVARELEPRLAKESPVGSTASAFRYEVDVPLLIPPIKAQNAPLGHEQKKKRGWTGFIVPIPNCTTTGLAVTVCPLEA